jgi:hypothetical protein
MVPATARLVGAIPITRSHYNQRCQAEEPEKTPNGITSAGTTESAHNFLIRPKVARNSLPGSPGSTGSPHDFLICRKVVRNFRPLPRRLDHYPHGSCPLAGSQRGVNTPSPLAGEGWDGGEDARVPPPPAPSPIKGEGRYLRAMGMTDLPLSAPGGGGFGWGKDVSLLIPTVALPRQRGSNDTPGEGIAIGPASARIDMGHVKPYGGRHQLAEGVAKR